MNPENRLYNCEICGNQRAWPIEMQTTPECCGRPMQKVPLEPCRASDTPEHARLAESGDACDDGRAADN